MDTRCCTPPSIGSGDDLLVASCRHRLFANEEDDQEVGDIALESSVIMQPSDSFPRPSGSRSSGQTRPSEPLDTNVELPSPTRLRRSPRRAFQPILIDPSREYSFGRTAFQGGPVAATTSDGITSTPWISSTTLAQPSPGLAGSQAADTTVAYLQTPEAQRANHAVSTHNIIGHLLYTPEIPPVCQAWRASLDAELDNVNKCSAPAQLPPLTTLIENALYVGSFPDAHVVPQLCALGVRHVINCCAQDIHTAPEVAASFNLHNFESFDADEYLILHRDYEAFARLVSTILANGERVFVHCIAGVNRSVTLCAAYLMDRLALNPVEAVRVFRANGRMRILDNRGFRHQLVDHYLQSGESHNPSIQLQ
ncbi:hypothetical protein JKF63_01464 [Porcisia hertigi]|uniref:protein-tyrosine-phosphatase n=1 Tax=Porcisia hertigi TaxID=2761500 RepID=A0A836HHQ3_9TRYP|nr:hypothetical protein JKF63_01464 [Porcisia hertigi]